MSEYGTARYGIDVYGSGVPEVIPNWPSSLPRSFLVDSYTDEEPDYVLQTTMDAPIPKQRRRFTAALRPFSGKMILDKEQKSTLKSFYYTNCASKFYFPDPDDPQNVILVRFTGKPKYNSISPDYQFVLLGLGKVPE